MGESLMPATKDNPKGYFEDMEFHLLNRRIFSLLGMRWFSMPTEEWVMAVKPLTDPAIRRVMSCKSGVWGWKDPRTALLLPLYWEHLTNPYLVIVERNHLACAKSIQARDGIHLTLGTAFTNQYYRRIYKTVREKHCPSKIVRYENLIKNPDIEIEGLARFLDLHGEVPKDFIDPKLCHY
jgi:hypothetical protein